LAERHWVAIAAIEAEMRIGTMENAERKVRKKFREMTDDDFCDAVSMEPDFVLPSTSPVDSAALRRLDHECEVVERALEIIADRLKAAQDAGIELRVRGDRCIEISYPESMDPGTRIEHHRNLDHHSWHVRALLEGRTRNVALEKTIVAACVYNGDEDAVNRYIAGSEALLYGGEDSEFSVPIVPADPITIGELADQVAEFGLWGVTALSFDLGEMNQWLAEGCPRERLIKTIRKDLTRIALNHTPTTGRGH
jgi:hypothetical protein